MSRAPGLSIIYAHLSAVYFFYNSDTRKCNNFNIICCQAQSAYYTAAFNSQALVPGMVENYHKGLALLQKELETRGTKFLHGDQPGLVDYTIWPFLERFEALPLLGKQEFAIDKTKYAVLVSN